MKSKLHLSAGALFILLLSLPHAFAQGAPGGATLDPRTGLAVNGTGGMGAAAPVAFDPVTGVPIPPPGPPSWKDTNWVDPDIVLSNVSFPDLPLSEIARNLRSEFKEQFDILLPSPTTGNNAFNQLNNLPVPDTDWNGMTVHLELRNVTASEIFNAMNLIFENDQTPLRWELRVNGHRQIALLRVLVVHSPAYMPPQQQEVRKVFFVGDLIGDEKGGGMSMEDIIKTVTDVWQMSNASGGKIQFHKEAQLLVVSGSPDQIDFMTQTLIALRQKVDQAHQARAKSKTGGGGGGDAK